MKRTPSDLLQRKRLWMALVLGAAFGASGVAVGADQGAARTADPSEAATAISTAPGKAESADSAFKKLDIGGKGYVTAEDVAQMPGFDKAFQAADVKRSGRLTLNEFRKAWSMYTTQKGPQG